MAQDIEALAHRIGWMENNFKQYVAGNTYNGVALTVSSLTAGFSLLYGSFTPYKKIDGSVWLKFYFGFDCNSTGTNFSVVVSGIKSKIISSYYQPFLIVTSSAAAGHYTFSSTRNSGTISPNTNNFYFFLSFGDTIDGIARGEIELESLPTWSDTF
jgi:hypothetical protein